MTGNKKKKLRSEFFLGTFLMLVFLPIILFAALWAATAIGIAGLFILTGGSNVLGPVLVVYGLLLVTLIILTYKFTGRFVSIIRRWIRMSQAQGRSHLFIDDSRLEDQAAEITYFEEDEMQSDRASY